MKEYAEDGIHVGHVIVDGAIAGDKSSIASPTQPAGKKA
jgi:hypothetical protein